jgi:hypothetical protein
VVVADDFDMMQQEGNMMSRDTVRRLWRVESETLNSPDVGQVSEKAGFGPVALCSR